MISRKEVEAAWSLIRPHVRRTPVLELGPGSFRHRRPAGAEARGPARSVAPSRAEARSISCSPRRYRRPASSRRRAAITVPRLPMQHGRLATRPRSSCPPSPLRPRWRVCKATARSCTRSVRSMPRHGRRRRSVRRETGALIAPAYEDPVVFAGAGSVALEFAEQATFDTLLVAVGGGGLIAGCAAAIGDQDQDRGRRNRRHADAARGAEGQQAGRCRHLRHRRRCAGREPHRHAQLRDRPESSCASRSW